MAKSKTKQHGSPGPTKSFLKRLSLINESNMNFASILPVFIQRFNGANRNLIISSNNSVYYNPIVDFDEHLIMTLRISNHLPTLDNLVSHSSNNFLLNAPYAQMCIMFFGKDEYALFKNSVRKHKNASDSGKMSKQRCTVIISEENNENFEQLKNFYKINSSIPYHIYHYVPDLITNDELNSIITETLKWTDGDGNTEYHNPINSSSFESVYVCNIIFKIIENNINETEEVNKTSHFISIDLGEIIYIDSSNNELLKVNVKLRLKNCHSKDFDLWKNYFSNINNSNIENIILNKKEKKKTY